MKILVTPEAGQAWTMLNPSPRRRASRLQTARAWMMSGKHFLRSLFAAVPAVILGSVVTAGAEPQFPALGIEAEIGGVSVVRYHPASKFFLKVEEKTDFSLIFETNGRTPDNSWPLLRITSDNGARGSIEQKSLQSVLGVTSSSALEVSPHAGGLSLSYAHGIIEIATGPLPFDPVLHDAVRRAMKVFQASIQNVCQSKGVNALFSEDQVRSEYNRLWNMPQEVEGDLRSALYLNKVQKDATAGSVVYLMCKKSSAAESVIITDRQATQGVPLDKILDLNAGWVTRGIKSAESLKIDSRNRDATAAVTLWTAFAGCALQKSPTESCKNNGTGCIIACNKNSISPLPHVDLCRLVPEVQNIHWPALNETIYAWLRNSPDLVNSGNLNQWADLSVQTKVGKDSRSKRNAALARTEDALLSPLSSDGTACTHSWGQEHGFSNHDASTIPVLLLKTGEKGARVKVGFALEFRSEVGQADIEPIEMHRQNDPATLFFERRRQLSESPGVRCELNMHRGEWKCS